MFHELDSVVLTRPMPEYGLAEGDVGTVVFCYPDREVFEVEFVTAEGDTLAVLTLTVDDLRPMRGQEILHVRSLTTPSRQA